MFFAIKIDGYYLSTEKTYITFNVLPDYNWIIKNDLLTYNGSLLIYNNGYIKLDTYNISKLDTQVCKIEYKSNKLLLRNNNSYIGRKFCTLNYKQDYDNTCLCTIHPFKTKLGICHWSSLYNFNNDLLIRGTNKIKSMNCDYIKLYIGRKSIKTYNLSNIEKDSNLSQLINHPSYKFAINNFSTIVFIALSTVGNNSKYWRYKYTTKDAHDEYNEMYKFCYRLSLDYPNKNFIIQNWESDWCITDKKGIDYTDNMIRWLNTRGDAVRACGSDNLKYAVEVNHVKKTLLLNQQSALTKLFPAVKVDYISYSAYDSQFDHLEDCINLIKKYNDDVYIGEFGVDQNICHDKDVETLIKHVNEIASKTKCSMAFIWQLYNNERGKMFGLYDNKDTLTSAGTHFINNNTLKNITL